MSLGYHVFVRVTGTTGRDKLASFANGGDAYLYADSVAKSRYFHPRNVVYVLGYDGRRWWQWISGELRSAKKTDVNPANHLTRRA